jgi:hypothetical protein
MEDEDLEEAREPEVATAEAVAAGVAAGAAAGGDAETLAPDTPPARPLGKLPPTPEQQASALLAAGDLRGDSLMVGREQELARLVQLLRAGRSAVVVGERGTGKSRLLREAYEVLTGQRRRLDPATRRVLGASAVPRVVIWLWQTMPIGDCLDELLTHLWVRGLLRLPALSEAGHAEMWQQAREGKTTLRKVIRAHAPNARAKKDAILASLRACEALLFIDALDRITPTGVAFFQALQEHAVLCVAAPEIERKEYLRRFWTGFVRLDLRPLPTPAMRRLLEHFLQTYPILISDRAMFRRQVLAVSAGNCGLLKNFLADAQCQRQVTLEEIRALAAADDADWFNLGPLYVFSLLAFTITKIALHGSGPAELYVVLSVGAVVALLVIRIFRVFFVFRPR